MPKKEKKKSPSPTGSLWCLFLHPRRVAPRQTKTTTRNSRTPDKPVQINLHIHSHCHCHGRDSVETTQPDPITTETRDGVTTTPPVGARFQVGPVTVTLTSTGYDPSFLEADSTVKTKRTQPNPQHEPLTADRLSRLQSEFSGGAQLDRGDDSNAEHEDDALSTTAKVRDGNNTGVKPSKTKKRTIHGSKKGKRGAGKQTQRDDRWYDRLAGWMFRDIVKARNW